MKIDDESNLKDEEMNKTGFDMHKQRESVESEEKVEFNFKTALGKVYQQYIR